MSDRSRLCPGETAAKTRWNVPFLSMAVAGKVAAATPLPPVSVPASGKTSAAGVGVEKVLPPSTDLVTVMPVPPKWPSKNETQISPAGPTETYGVCATALLSSGESARGKVYVCPPSLVYEKRMKEPPPSKSCDRSVDRKSTRLNSS